MIPPTHPLGVLGPIFETPEFRGSEQEFKERLPHSAKPQSSQEQYEEEEQTDTV